MEHCCSETSGLVLEGREELERGRGGGGGLARAAATPWSRNFSTSMAWPGEVTVKDGRAVGSSFGHY